MFALSRWGGLRLPSEPKRLRWCDIDWERQRFLVHSTKTEHFANHKTRWVPMFPELQPLFDERFTDAAEGDELVLPMMQGKADSTFSEGVRRALTRLDIEHWPRTFHSMRSTRQTELQNEFAIHKVCSRLGNSPSVAHKHYLQTTDGDFQKAAHFCAHHTPTPRTTEEKPTGSNARETPENTVCG